MKSFLNKTPNKSRTVFEKIIFILVVGCIAAFIAASRLNLDIFVYAACGTYIIIGLIAFFRPKLVFDVLKKENEDYLVRNQRKIPSIKRAFRYAGVALALTGAALNYILIVYY